MKYFKISLFLLMLTWVGCAPKYLKQYKKDMIKSPETQAETDNNIILKYLLDNKLNFQSTESGIYYSIDKPGDDTRPTVAHVVNTHYKGYRLDGQVFDSSYDRGESIEFPLTGVIKGWQEAIPLLGKGGKGTFLIPSGLAYGTSGAGADIPANTVLIFDVELLDFYKPEEKAERQAAKDDTIIKQHLADKGIDAKRTESGIYYTVLRPGTGAKPTLDDKVKVHYNGTLIDGTKFDSSYDRNEPAVFPLKGVVQGWQEGIPLFNEGGKGTIYLPSALAYGERGAGGIIPPNAVLVFDVELLEIVDEAAEKEQAAAAGAGQAAKDDAIIQKYLADNNIKAEKTPEGVYYIVDEAGTAPKPTLDSKVTVHYEGTLLNGKKFDSSFDRGKPATFPLRGVVPGWQVGIPQFGKGGKGKLIIPSGMAYGARGAGKDIPPHSVLIFRVEIIDVK